jgi:hypothetical protein
MKKLSLVAAAAIASSALFAADASNEEMMKEIQALKQELNALKSTVEKSNLDRVNKEISALKKTTGGDHLKFDADYRFSYDNIHYKMADGSKAENNDLLTNRLWIGAKYAPRDDLSFVAKLSYLKAFGDSANHSQRANQPGTLSNFDWVTNENAQDGDLSVKEVYFIYFGDIGNSVPYTASVGRRPSTGGFPMNLREDDKAASPLAHLINVEFDGGSLMFDLSKITSVSGMYIKACLGRGLTNASARFDMGAQPYAKNDNLNPDIDMYGFIFVPYDDGKYAVRSEFVWAKNLIGYTNAQIMSAQMTGQMPSFTDVGQYHGGNVIFSINGIGNFWSMFWEDTRVFLSYAYSQTDPQHGYNMLGSSESKFGDSWYAGVQFPDLIYDGAKWGFEYNTGSKYWRSMTYGEDTMIGSKVAARGEAYEAYYTFPLIGEMLTGQVRYTYIDYDYSGSNSFFGDDGTPYKISDLSGAQAAQTVDSSSDLRVYVRYRY